jgi:RNA polymerase-binding transcription factor DksA
LLQQCALFLVWSAKTKLIAPNVTPGSGLNFWNARLSKVFFALILPPNSPPFDSRNFKNQICHMTNDLKVRYSDEDLQDFKSLIDGKLTQAQDELDTTERQIADLNENGFNQQGGDWYDDSTAHTDLEMLQRLLQRQQRHVQDLKNALLRIQNKTYGICTVTGQLISKERLRLVPHATKSMDGKAMAGGRETPVGLGSSDPFGLPDAEERTTGKPIGDKVRLSNGKRPAQGGGEDWEMDNETLEDAGYNRRNKFDDDED